jgi:hypothetical protein
MSTFFDGNNGYTCPQALSIMGGVFAVLPAYEADLYGAKYIGAIHGRCWASSL